MTDLQLSQQIEQEMLDAGYCTKHDLDFSTLPCQQCDDPDCFAEWCPKCRYASDIDAAFRDEWRGQLPAVTHSGEPSYDN